MKASTRWPVTYQLVTELGGGRLMLASFHLAHPGYKVQSLSARVAVTRSEEKMDNPSNERYTNAPLSELKTIKSSFVAIESRDWVVL